MKKRFIVPLFLLAILLTACQPSKPAASTAPSVQTQPVEQTTTVPFEETQPVEQTTTPFGETQPAAESTQAPSASLSDTYSLILADFEKALDYRYSDRYKENMQGMETLDYSILPSVLNNEGTFWASIFEYSSYDAESKASFGYILMDITGDGSPELFLVRQDRTILSIFTTLNGQVKNVRSFWSRYSCVVTDEGYLYTSGSSGAAYTVFEISRLIPGTSETETLVEFGTDGYDQNTLETIYFEMVSGQYTQIDEARFDTLQTEYPFEHGTSFSQAEILPL